MKAGAEADMKTYGWELRTRRAERIAKCWKPYGPMRNGLPHARPR